MHPVAVQALQLLPHDTVHDTHWAVAASGREQLQSGKHVGSREMMAAGETLK